jgi:type I restriction enzyme S subunit
MENGKGCIARGLTNNIGFGSTEFHVLRPNDNRVTSEWLFWLTIHKKLRKNAEKNMSGSAGQKRVPVSFFDKYKVFLPSIPDQIHVTETLDKIKSIIDARKKQIEKCDEYIKSVFYTMFGDPITNPMGWGTSRLDKTPIEIIDGDRGTNYPKSEDFSSDNYCLFLNTSNVRKGFFNFDNTQFISYEKDQQLRKGKLIRNDVVLTTRGTVGNIAHYNNSILYDNVRINSGMLILRPDAAIFNAVYVTRLFLSDFITKQISKALSGSAQPQLPIRVLSGFSIIIPPIDLQTQFAAIVEKTEAHKELLKQSLAKMETLFDCLMDKYFN